MEQTGCNANDKFAFILHGWKENCDVEWVPLLISSKLLEITKRKIKTKHEIHNVIKLSNSTVNYIKQKK